MAEKTKVVMKALFENGDRPDENAFIDLIDSYGQASDVTALQCHTHTHSNQAQLDLVTDGDHDVRTDNPHSITGDQLYSTTSWLPSLTGDSAAGAATYTTRLGGYHLFGDIVFINGFVAWSAHTGTGRLVIDNLPFAASSASAMERGGLHINRFANFTFSGFPTIEVISGTTIGRIYDNQSGVALTQLAMPQGTGELSFSGFYFRA